MKNKLLMLASGSLVLASFAFAGTAFAHENDNGGISVGSVIHSGVVLNAHADADSDNDNNSNTSEIHAGAVLGWHASSTKPVLLQGNGQPVVGGTVSAVNGSTITITTATAAVYTINASSATIVKGHATTTPSSVAVGDKVLVQGAISGNAVTATSVIVSGSASSTTTAAHGGFGKMFGRVGGFFRYFFGFF